MVSIIQSIFPHAQHWHVNLFHKTYTYIYHQLLYYTSCYITVNTLRCYIKSYIKPARRAFKRLLITCFRTPAAWC